MDQFPEHQPPEHQSPDQREPNLTSARPNTSFIDELLSAKAVYVLYLAGLVTGGVSSIVGVVVAYIQGNNLDSTQVQEWERSHYQYQIRTFWIGLLYMIVGSILLFVLVGFLVWLFWLIWLVVRCVKGLQFAAEQKPIPNPTGWWLS